MAAMVNVSKAATAMQAIVDAPSTRIVAQGNPFPWTTPRDLNSQNKNEMLARAAQAFSPLFNAIWNGPLSTWFRNQIESNPAEFWERYVKHDQANDRLVLTNFHTFSYQDRDPLDMSANCCNVPFKMQHCNREFELNRVCDLECRDTIESYIQRKRVSGRFANEDDGHIIDNQMSKDFNLLLSFAFDRIRHSIVGTNNTTSDGLGVFNGVKSFVDSQYTVKTVGGNIIASLESMNCRITGMSFDPASSVIAFPERLKMAFEKAVAPNMFGNYYDGIRYSDGTYYYKDIKVVFDPYVDYLTTTDMGSGILLDLRFVGILWGLPNMALPMEFLTSEAYKVERETSYAEEQTITNNLGTCLEECRSLYDFGTAVVTDYNYVMKVANIANTSTCPAAVFEGTNNSIAPKTPTLV